MNLCNFGCGQEAKYQFKNGKWCCSEHYASCPARKANRFTINANKVMTQCKFCNSKINKTGISRHEQYCYLNPKNLKLCPVCNDPIKNYRENVTCSCACSNTYFRSGENNPNWKNRTYRSTCFLYHNKECIICGECNIVSVHHYDNDRSNELPTNLVPLCPTHHQYLHSRYKYLIEAKVDTYVSKFVSNFGEGGLEPPLKPTPKAGGLRN